MHAKVHKELAYQALQDYPKPALLRFLLKAVAKPDWKKNEATRVRWLKEWMDMPDDRHHSSKMRNDHSYKLEKNPQGKFVIKFIAKTKDQATVVARLKYDARDVAEWKVEEEWRTCGLEPAKSIHWVIDVTTPPHTVAGWDDGEHSAIEKHFDELWSNWYDPTDVIKGTKQKIPDIYRWAKAFAENRYDRNAELRDIYRAGGSIKKKGRGEQLGKAVIADVALNLGAYLAYLDRRIKYDVVETKLP